MTLNDVPDSTQTLATTQPLIKTNFQTIDAAFQIDHVAYVGADQGKHNQVTLPAHVGTVPATGVAQATELYLFNQNAAPSSVPDIWLKRGTNATAYPTSYPITGTKTVLTKSWSYLPSGIILQWGNDSVNANSTISVTFLLTFPSTAINIQLTPFSSSDTPANSIVIAGSKSATAFNVLNNGSSQVAFYWFAIGI